MAVTGKNAAVVKVGKYTFTGFPAWLIWLSVHLYRLIGLHNHLMVFINWDWDYPFFEQVVRLITCIPQKEMLERGC